MPWIEPVMVFCAPRPTASMAITAATPITIPRMVSPERSLLAVRLSSASRKDCQNVHSLILHHHAIAEADDRAGSARRRPGRG